MGAVNVADGIEVVNQQALKYGEHLDYLGGPRVITRFLKNARGRRRGPYQSSVMAKEFNPLLLALKVEDECSKPRNMWSL